MEITGKTVDVFRRDFEKAVFDLQSKYDVTIELGNITYWQDRFSAKLSVKNGRDPEMIARADFDNTVWKYAHLGLTKGMYNRIFKGIDGRLYALRGFNVRAPKYPLIIMDIGDNRELRAGEGFIRELRNEYFTECIVSDPDPKEIETTGRITGSDREEQETGKKTKTEKLTNEVLWEKMDRMASKGLPPAENLRFLELVRQAYDQDLGLIIRCMYRAPGHEIANQAYLEVMGQRYLMCYTSKSHAEREWREGGSWDICSARNVLNNMFNKDSIGGLIFNPDDQNSSVLCMKFMLQMIMSGNHPKPPFFHDTGK